VDPLALLLLKIAVDACADLIHQAQDLPGQPEVRQRTHGVVRKFVPKWFHKMLDTLIAEI
jgi:hypothetical protein